MDENLVVKAINAGELRFDLQRVYKLGADHDFAGRVDEIPLFTYYIAVPGRQVIVDAMAWVAEKVGKFGIPGYEPPPGLAEKLAAAGIDRHAVSDVLITHAHFDHYGGLSLAVDGAYVPMFGNARHYLGSADFQPQDFDDFDRRTLGLLEEKGLLTLVDGDLDLGDGLQILAAPGESEGHKMLRVQAAGLVLYFVGDLFHHELEFEDWRENCQWAEAAAMARSKRRLMQTAATEGAIVYFSHIQGGYRVKRENDRFVWEQDSLLKEGFNG